MITTAYCLTAKTIRRLKEYVHAEKQENNPRLSYSAAVEAAIIEYLDRRENERI